MWQTRASQRFSSRVICVGGISNRGQMEEKLNLFFVDHGRVRLKVLGENDSVSTYTTDTHR